MAVRNPCFKDQNWSHLREPVEREREEQRREEEEGEEDGDQAKIKRYGCLDFGMETTLSMNSVWITWNLRLDMVNLLSLNLGF